MLIDLEWPDDIPLATGQLATDTARGVFDLCIKAWRESGKLTVSIEHETVEFPRDGVVETTLTGETKITISPR